MTSYASELKPVLQQISRLLLFYNGYLPPSLRTVVPRLLEMSPYLAVLAASCICVRSKINIDSRKRKRTQTQEDIVDGNTPVLPKKAKTSSELNPNRSIASEENKQLRDEINAKITQMVEDTESEIQSQEGKSNGAASLLDAANKVVKVVSEQVACTNDTIREQGMKDEEGTGRQSMPKDLAQTSTGGEGEEMSDMNPVKPLKNVLPDDDFSAWQQSKLTKYLAIEKKHTVDKTCSTSKDCDNADNHLDKRSSIQAVPATNIQSTPTKEDVVPGHISPQSVNIDLPCDAQAEELNHKVATTCIDLCRTDDDSLEATASEASDLDEETASNCGSPLPVTRIAAYESSASSWSPPEMKKPRPVVTSIDKLGKEESGPKLSGAFKRGNAFYRLSASSLPTQGFDFSFLENRESKNSIEGDKFSAPHIATATESVAFLSEIDKTVDTYLRKQRQQVTIDL
mmetsp:Transcript_14825/g.16772  ORF Transcript_14825/g.16772 Transcript_14825/m.16772 type:complete len:456 (-) Transcript_14825:1924-3291(-)